jgi:hypothetical protein
MSKNLDGVRPWPRPGLRGNYIGPDGNPYARAGEVEIVRVNRKSLTVGWVQGDGTLGWTPEFFRVDPDRVLGLYDPKERKNV